MLKIIQVVVSPFQQNCRIIGDEKSAQAAVVDPGGDVPLILQELAKAGLRCTEVWLTHSHLDHCGGVKELLEKTGATLIGHRGESEMRSAVVQICAMYGIPPGLMENCPEPSRFIEEGDKLKVGPYIFDVIFTPGHSPGHLSFYHREGKILLAGDTLFAGSIGRSDLPGGDFDTLMKSIKDRILTLPGDTVVMSGHGPDTLVDTERRTNPFIVGGSYV